MAVELDVAKQTPAATFFNRVCRAVDTTIVKVDLRVIMRCVVGAPARVFLRNGICIVFPAEVGAETVGLVDAGVW